MGIKKSQGTEEILKAHHLKSTPQRLEVLNIFLHKKEVMNLQLLQEYLSSNFDRITLYRTLNIFEEKGLIHKIPGSEKVSYALCKHDSPTHSHEDNHVHFSCIKCSTTFCLNDIEIPILKLPKKYKVQKLNFIAEGLCDKCI